MSNDRTASTRGSLFVVSAPSGAGKTTLCRRIIDIFPNLRHSVSFTTRSMRPGEREGVDYFFVDPEVFAQMIAAGSFAEWAEVHGNRYGTAIDTLEQWRNCGHDVLLDIDIQGANQLRKSYGQSEAVFIFILPPDLTELRRRLEGRGTDAPEVIERRISNARGEIQASTDYDYIVINDDFEMALTQLKSIIVAEGCRSSRVLPALATGFDINI
ncbi:guanylate kinase [Geoalkalibacter ferrihydriticus]|uniref:Guanylate kinase n=2 Tax=Geoalkalibacter ferrihydriticus TaxID=392333 RepID=A0A0C2HPD6_9BACT|nr:guanylate kinase [Geoalkalibacter ferrihydriticus]KIH76770.1 guanylate kinase [Geoalkalibacter ferrihydriticus DSM 17813]SDL52382.1 guanylate kinase [Geoalkalibacter ferrihydriticus]